MYVRKWFSLSWMFWGILWCSIKICWSLTCGITQLLSTSEPDCSSWLLQPQWVQLMHVGERVSLSWMFWGILRRSIKICWSLTCGITQLLSTSEPDCSSWLLQPEWVQLMHVGERVSLSWMFWGILRCFIKICWSLTCRIIKLVSSSKPDCSSWLLQP
jgi:hypothetical protein